jgi:2-polyprenyl-6-methoxyphenol hydroxylase-like FAD-dependent oxidoreductase
MTLPVLIIGAGLGGICLAHALHKNNIPYKLFEQDQRSNFRAQGYRLRITKDGVNALQEALTPGLFTLFEKTCADTAKMGVSIKPDGSPAPSKSGLGPQPQAMSGSVYTVDRSTFRETLLASLEGHVFFGKSLTHYKIHDDKVTAFFTDGTSEDGELLVGADGVRSRVRKQYVPEYRGIDTGMRIIFGKTPLTPEFLDTLPESHRQGMSLVTDPDDASQPTFMFECIHFPHADEVSFPLPSPYMYWCLLARASSLPISDERSWHISTQEAAGLSCRLTETWNPSLRSVFGMQDESQTAVRSILSAMPEIAPWEPSSRVTLLGDAIHVMPPTGAMGANTALRDAGDLARRIVEAGGAGGVDENVIGAYEADLREFAKMAIGFSWKGGMNSFGLRPAEECERILL